MFIPRYPETMDVAAPIIKARVENIPLYSPGARKIPASSSFQVEEKPSSELSNTKITTENKAMKILTYLYSVNKKLFAPSLIASCNSAAFSSIYKGRDNASESAHSPATRQRPKGTVGGKTTTVDNTLETRLSK
jgi:hypothetical protein